MRYEVSIEISAPPEKVWAVLADVERWPEWAASMTRVQILGIEPLAAGSAVRIKQPRLPATVWRVTEWTPGTSFSWTARSAGVTTTAGHRITPESGDGVTVTVDIAQRGPLAPIVAVFAASLTRRYVDMEAQGLKRRCETR